MTVVNRADKRVILIPVYESMTAAGAADLFLQWVVWCYSMPQEVIADQDPPFHICLLATIVHEARYQPLT